MDKKDKTKRASFCCPHHGVLPGSVEYFSIDMGRKRLVDVSVAYCKDCQKYYTPFVNLLAVMGDQPIKYKGCQIAAGMGRAEKSSPKKEVRAPYFVDIQEEMRRKKQEWAERRGQSWAERELARKQKERLQREKNKQRIENLREVSCDEITLTNKPCFTKEHTCPCCKGNTKKENVKIVQCRSSVLARVRHCPHCAADYITPEQFRAIEKKASWRIYGGISHPFVLPQNVECEYQEGKYLFIPHGAINFNKFNRHHLPPRGDEYYDMTDEEYLWVRIYYLPKELPFELRQESFLGKMGYSAGESEIRRHHILEKCVKEYGKVKVINQLQSNISLREKQRDGRERFLRAINIWRRDIWYVENEL